VLLWCDRHCCLCKKACGVNIEVHHLVPKGKDGGDEIENAMPLCFDCHSEVLRYNDKHPRGTKYKVDELKARRDQVYEEFTRSLVPPIHYTITQRLPAGGVRQLPDVGFWIQNLGDSLPVRGRVLLDIILNGNPTGPPAVGYYSGQKLWNLNPRSGVSGHFPLPDGIGDDVRIEVKIDLSIIDAYNREHRNLPVGYVYLRDGNDWYLEP